MNFLLLHGLAGNPNDWSVTAEYLENKGHKCFVPKIPYLSSDYLTLNALTEEVKKIIPIEFLEENAIIAGNSLGGSIALQIGEKSKLIVLVASYTSTSTERIGRGIKTLDREIKRIFFDPSILSIEKIKEYESLWFGLTKSRNSFSKLRRVKRAASYNVPDELYAEMQDKIHVICGENDELSPLQSFFGLKEKYPKISIETIEKCGHAIPIEKPIKLADLLILKAGN